MVDAEIVEDDDVLRSRFFAILKGLQLDYESQVKAWMRAKRGGSVSELLADDPDKFRSLVDGLSPSDRHMREQNQRLFKVAVEEYAEVAS